MRPNTQPPNPAHRSSLSRHAGERLRLFLTSFPNPRPEVEVRSIDLVSAMNRAGFFVVGMPLE